MPEWQNAIDRALACYAGGPGLNVDGTKVFSAPILSGAPPPAACTHSPNWKQVTCYGRCKKREIAVSVLAVPSMR